MPKGRMERPEHVGLFWARSHQFLPVLIHALPGCPVVAPCSFEHGVYGVRSVEEEMAVCVDVGRAHEHHEFRLVPGDPISVEVAAQFQIAAILSSGVDGVVHSHVVRRGERQHGICQVAVARIDTSFFYQTSKVAQGLLCAFFAGSFRDLSGSRRWRPKGLG